MYQKQFDKEKAKLVLRTSCNIVPYFYKFYYFNKYYITFFLLLTFMLWSGHFNPEITLFSSQCKLLLSN